jgi:hypothetical protein
VRPLTRSECARMAWTCRENAAAFDKALLRAVRHGKAGSIGLTIDELAAARDAALRRARQWERAAGGVEEGVPS